jgi:hypothetical protein
MPLHVGSMRDDAMRGGVIRGRFNRCAGGAVKRAHVVFQRAPARRSCAPSHDHHGGDDSQPSGEAHKRPDRPKCERAARPRRGDASDGPSQRDAPEALPRHRAWPDAAAAVAAGGHTGFDAAPAARRRRRGRRGRQALRARPASAEALGAAMAPGPQRR